ncbi:hypothetical protein [Brevibacterium yomogidense]|uniref:hypothetical protein n=1 Tax=Brevibacterium yomogidense TaxID=946573 RepID=UPI0018E05969|nr:hypothetical protein [Brevibacterium yomogidense]
MTARPLPAHRPLPAALVAAGLMVAVCGLGAGPAVVAAAPAAAAVTTAQPDPVAEAEEAPAQSGESPAAGEDVRDTYRERVAAYLETVAGGWADDVVAVAPEAVGSWDDRQRAMIDPRIEALEDDGWTVRIAVLPHFSYPYDRGLDLPDIDAGLQRGLTRIAEADPHGKTVYLLARGSSVTSSVYADGHLQRELAAVYPLGPPYVNTEQTAAELSYALRAVAADSPLPELLPEETAPVGWTGVRYRALSMQLGETGTQIMTAAFLAAAAVGAVLLVLSWLVLLPRTSGPLARLFGTRIDRAHEAAALASLKDRAVRAHRSLTRAKRLESSLETAVGRLPDPGATDSPLVWAGWTALEEEHDGRDRTLCFFRPDLPADRQESVDVLGAQLVVPVSDLAAERLEKGRAPSYLSLSGIDRGKPYWTRASSPWAASGYGAFGPLSEAIAAMPAQWEPAAGAVRIARAVETGRTQTPSTRAGASPWARTALLAVTAALALSAGIVGGVHDAGQMEKVYTAEPGAPGSPVSDPQAAQRQIIAEAVAASEDAPYVDQWTGLALVGQDVSAVGEVAESVAEDTGRDVRVIALVAASSGVLDTVRLEDRVEEALPDGTIAVLLSKHSASIVTGGLEEDYSADRADRPQPGPDDTVVDKAIAELRWAAKTTWVPADPASASSTGDGADESFMPAPGTDAWVMRTWTRTLLGAGGATLAVLIVGIVFRRLVTDRTDPTAREQHPKGRAGGRRGDSRERRRPQERGRAQEHGRRARGRKRGGR